MAKPQPLLSDQTNISNEEVKWTRLCTAHLHRFNNMLSIVQILRKYLYWGSIEPINQDNDLRNRITPIQIRLDYSLLNLRNIDGSLF